MLKILGPSPMSYTLKKIGKLRGGSTPNVDLSELSQLDLASDKLTPKSDKNVLFEFYKDANKNIYRDVLKTKPDRMSNEELRNFYKYKAKLTSDQKLIESVLKDSALTRFISEQAFDSLQDSYEFRRKYKNYLRFKRFLPLSLVYSFTGKELVKMSYASAVGSKSVALTIPGAIGYSLPAFYFFHMSYYYVPNKMKPICNLLKYTTGGAFLVINHIVDEIFSHIEERIFNEPVPIDITQTGGTIPADVGDINEIRKVLADMENWGTKTY